MPHHIPSSPCSAAREELASGSPGLGRCCPCRRGRFPPQFDAGSEEPSRAAEEGLVGGSNSKDRGYHKGTENSQGMELQKKHQGT